MRFLTCAVLALGLVGCSTYMPQRYSIAADNNVALKGLGADNIAVGPFTKSGQFDNFCRGAGPISPPDDVGFEGYIRKALADELKVAGIYKEKAPGVTLTGNVDQLSFSSARGLTGGSWDVGLTLRSSNGRSMSSSEHYEFNSGFAADTACKQTAEAFLPTVQNLIGKIVQASEFKTLVTP
jgi:hypothetical protein